MLAFNVNFLFFLISSQNEYHFLHHFAELFFFLCDVFSWSCTTTGGMNVNKLRSVVVNFWKKQS